MKSGTENFLDLGCCLGQELRVLLIAGVPVENLTGLELKRDFVDLGFELFRDRERLEGRFVVGDFFDEELEGKFDMIHAGYFFSLFSREEQVQILGRAVGLLKRKKGRVLFGQQVGGVERGVNRHPRARSGEVSVIPKSG